MTNPQQHNTILNLDLVVLDEVDSTNDELRRRIAQDNYDVANKALAIAAQKQSKGKGRLGRSWASPEGGVYLSLALGDINELVDYSSLSLVVALGVRAALAELLGVPGLVQVKWPNDIMCTEGKFAGILIETIVLAAQNEGSQAHRVALVGIGINVRRPQDGAFEHAAYLSDYTDEALEIKQVISIVLQNLKEYYGRWKDADCCFEEFKDEYERHLSLLGKQVQVTNLGTKDFCEGIARGVDEQGYLLVETVEGVLVPVASGEVTLRKIS